MPFANFYTGLETTTSSAPFLSTDPVPYLIFPLTLSSNAHGLSYGGEVFATWSVNSRLRISMGYSLIHMNVGLNPGNGPNVIAIAGLREQHATKPISGRSALTLTKRWSWDATFSRLGNLPDSGDGGIPSYSQLDTQLKWRITDAVEFDVVGRNLLQRRHAEFSDEDSVLHSLVARSVFGKVTWRF